MTSESVLCLFALDSAGEATGNVHFFCSDSCRDNFQPDMDFDWECGESSISATCAGTVCDSCKKIIEQSQEYFREYTLDATWESLVNTVDDSENDPEGVSVEERELEFCSKVIADIGQHAREVRDGTATIESLLARLVD